MRKQIEKTYKSLRINLSTSKIIQQYVDFINTDNEIFRKQFELFHMDFLLGLNSIREIDKKSFDRYIKNINNTKGELNFWGEKFEVFMHSKLIEGEGRITKNLRRGIDGKEPDLIFDFNNEILGMELTTSKFAQIPKTKEHILKKITEKILEKKQ